MATLREIKQRITGIQKTQQITRALKMVAAVKFRRAQQSILQARPYAQRLNDIMGHVAFDVDRKLHPLLAVREPERIGYVIFTGDQGLCGSFNNNVIRKAEAEFAKHQENSMDLILVGKKGNDYFGRRGYNIIGSYLKFYKDLKFNKAVELSKLIVERYVNKKLDRIYLIYNEFKSAIRQNISVEQLLPIIPFELDGKRGDNDFIYEPDSIKLLDILCPRHINVKIWRVLLESYASEMGARMTAMEYATENANNLINELTMEYNKVRQEKITGEILEIVSGSEALRAS
jgi:F-type H+-transporting ATPase subunit gamma